MEGVGKVREAGRESQYKLYKWPDHWVDKGLPSSQASEEENGQSKVLCNNWPLSPVVKGFWLLANSLAASLRMLQNVEQIPTCFVWWWQQKARDTCNEGKGQGSYHTHGLRENSGLRWREEYKVVPTAAAGGECELSRLTALEMAVTKD